MSDLQKLLKLETMTTGYAAVIDGVLRVETVYDTEKGAARAALHLVGYYVLHVCDNPDCQVYQEYLQRAVPDAKLVPVSVVALPSVENS